jgi:ribosomal protein S11
LSLLPPAIPRGWRGSKGGSIFDADYPRKWVNIACRLTDGIPATLSSVSSPSDVAVDAAGNLYISATGNNRIRKVNASTGVITTVAGNGAFGFSGDGGAATLAALGSPAGVAVSNAGDVYISIIQVSRIRRVVSVTLIKIPNVIGLPQAGAQAALGVVGFSIGTITTAHSGTVPIGNVISQSPAGGEFARKGSPVSLVVSSGPDMVTVPNVTGLTEANARSSVEAVGLIVGTVSTANSDTVPAGNVISQEPGGGSSVSRGSSVSLVVSSGL